MSKTIKGVKAKKAFKGKVKKPVDKSELKSVANFEFTDREYMTTSDVLLLTRLNSGYGKKVVKEVYRGLVKAILDCTENGKEVHLVGLFYSKFVYNKERRAMNVVTKEFHTIPATITVRFSPKARVKAIMRRLDPKKFTGRLSNAKE